MTDTIPKHSGYASRRAHHHDHWFKIDLILETVGLMPDVFTSSEVSRSIRERYGLRITHCEVCKQVERFARVRVGINNTRKTFYKIKTNE